MEGVQSPPGRSSLHTDPRKAASKSQRPSLGKLKLTAGCVMINRCTDIPWGWLAVASFRALDSQRRNKIIDL